MDAFDITENNNNITFNPLMEIPNVSYKFFVLILILMLYFIIILKTNKKYRIFQLSTEDLAILDKEGETIRLITDKMRVGEIRYSALPMEYPPTSSEGIAIVYNIETWDNYESAFKNVRAKLNCIFINYIIQEMQISHVNLVRSD